MFLRKFPDSFSLLCRGKRPEAAKDNLSCTTSPRAIRCSVYPSSVATAGNGRQSSAQVIVRTLAEIDARGGRMPARP